MSMIGNYLMVEEKVISKVQQREITIEEIIYNTDTDEEDYLDIDKSWHAIHYLLCGETWEGERPLFNVVLGGKEINKQDVGYGPARYLTALEVQEVYDAIKEITVPELHRRFNIKELQEADIYPQFDREDDFEYISGYFVYLQDFFGRAADRGKAVIMYLN
ncbi:MAG: YfbM family protein [Bacillota bacterium]|nr:YfbM family protein [Bacillota bacterium]